MDESITVIIPAHNEARYIRDTIKSVLSCRHSNKQILVACNGCTDSTAEIVKDFPSVRSLQLSCPNVSSARNAGARSTDADHLVFLDADTKLSEHALEDISRVLCESDCVGTLKVKADNRKFIANTFMLIKNLSHHLSIYHGCSGVIFCRKSAFDLVGGFNPAMIKREDVMFINSAISIAKCEYRYVHSSYAVTSMRRYERLGYAGIILFWLKYWCRRFVGQKDNDYPVIR